MKNSCFEKQWRMNTYAINSLRKYVESLRSLSNQDLKVEMVIICGK